jgi:hypothetical protein
MPTRRIAEVILKKRLHRGGDHRIDRRTGVEVEIDASHRQNTRALSASEVTAASSPIALRRAPTNESGIVEATRIHAGAT